MPEMNTGEGDTDSGGRGVEGRQAGEAGTGPERGSSAAGQESLGTRAGKTGSSVAENNNNAGQPGAQTDDSTVVMAGTTARGYDATTSPGDESGGQVDRHGNGDAEATDQGVNNTRGGQEAGRGAEEGRHVDGEADTDAAAATITTATVAAGEGACDDEQQAADGDGDIGNHSNENQRTLLPHETADMDNPESVINVEIRPKSTAGSRTNEQQTGGNTAPLANTKQGARVAPQGGLNDSFSAPLNTPVTEDTAVEGPVTNANPVNSSKPPKRKKMKKGIFISYSPDAGFVERKFVVECVRQFKEINLAEDIWFDKDEKIIDNPSWFSQRLEAAERCRASVLFLSESYFRSAVSVYEVKTLLDRHKQDPNAVRIFPVLFSNGEDVDIPRHLANLSTNCVNLTGTHHLKKSLAERASVVVGSLIIELEKIASINAPPAPFTPPDTEFTGEFRKKKICHWGANDLQEWLFKLGVKEFYRQSLAENMVDGFLLMATTDQEMVTYLAIDSRIVRKKITQQVLATLEKENKQPDTWHIRAKSQRSKPNSIYLIYDPSDVRLAQNMKHDLAKKNLQVLHHQKLGASKEEFLLQNGPVMAHASFVLIILTEAATTSPFVFHEVLFAEWLGKKTITAMFKNTWPSLRSSLRAVLGDCPAVDFEKKMYQESMDVLEHYLKPLRSVPGVVLEQSYLNKMSEGIRPLSVISNQFMSRGGALESMPDGGNSARVFISFQWDMASRVEDIRNLLDAAGFTCWADLGSSMGVMSPGGPRGSSGVSSRAGGGGGVSGSHAGLGIHLGDSSPESLNTQIQRNMKASSVVICCITPKYMQSDNCVKDLTLAENLRKAIVPVMLRFCPWPPESAPAPVRKILVKHAPVDLSNDKLYRQNMAALLDRIKRHTGQK